MSSSRNDGVHLEVRVHSTLLGISSTIIPKSLNRKNLGIREELRDPRDGLWEFWCMDKETRISFVDFTVG